MENTSWREKARTASKGRQGRCGVSGGGVEKMNMLLFNMHVKYRFTT